ncbi:MAG: tRNA lysidine(34) synthetase TilS [Tannerellaceae bacterium]|jgi:tRNA(Ile)-lysidine synthase|nr:tRNA lysidine(34) synthetase TilS [Tannerellaceae bacterium]
MIQTIGAYIERHRLLDKSGAPVIVGLSGGADSVALLTALVRLGYNCIAAHCNFYLRGDESDRDESFAFSVASGLDVPFRKVFFSTLNYAFEFHLSTEMAARELRYNWFEELRLREGAQAIAVGHHRDDNAETLLINLTRGTGIRGLRGMLPRNGHVVRPLLCTNRRYIREWLKAERQDYVEDGSNLSGEYMRNRIRLHVMPMLERINPSASENLARTAEHLGEAEQIYLAVMAEARKTVMAHPERLDVEALMRFPAPATVLYELLRPLNFSRHRADDIFKSIDKPGRKFYSSTHRIVTARDHLVATPLGAASQPEHIIEHREAVVYCGPYTFFLTNIIRSDLPAIPAERNIACLDADRLSYPLCLRHPQPGDRFVPLGMQGSRKLSDFFVSLRYDAADKENAWLLCSADGNIAWVAGERIDHRYRITRSTERVLRLERRREDS